MHLGLLIKMQINPIFPKEIHEKIRIDFDKAIKELPEGFLGRLGMYAEMSRQLHKNVIF